MYRVRGVSVILIAEIEAPRGTCSVEPPTLDVQLPLMCNFWPHGISNIFMTNLFWRSNARVATNRWYHPCESSLAVENPACRSLRHDIMGIQGQRSLTPVTKACVVVRTPRPLAIIVYSFKRWLLVVNIHAAVLPCCHWLERPIGSTYAYQYVAGLINAPTRAKV